MKEVTVSLLAPARLMNIMQSSNELNNNNRHKASQKCQC